MDEDTNMADNTQVEDTTGDYSPNLEPNQFDDTVSDSTVKSDKTLVNDDSDDGQSTTNTTNDKDKNWRALREEYERAKQQLKSYQTKYGNIDDESFKASELNTAKKSHVVNPILNDSENTSLMLDEFKAQQKYPELDSTTDSYNPLFESAVAGIYRSELDKYAQSVMSGKQAVLPSASLIASRVKKQWDRYARPSVNQSNVNSAETAKEQAGTLQGRSASQTKREVNDSELKRLKLLSRYGGSEGYVALAKRLSNSNL
jgi:hypothetical protein